MLKLSLNTQTVLTGICIGLLVYYIIKRMRYRLPPGPWCIPLVGHYKSKFCFFNLKTLKVWKVKMFINLKVHVTAPLTKPWLLDVKLESRRLDSQQINHQICVEFWDMFCLAIKYYSVKKTFYIFYHWNLVIFLHFFYTELFYRS